MIYIEVPVTAKAMSKQKTLQQEILPWCKDNIKGDYNYQKKEMSLDKESPVWIFGFENDDDLVAFKLRWV